MLLRPFLTDLDPQAAAKGSVDPMGATPIWSRMGRRVVGNLTTVSNSVRDFKTLVLGFAAVEQLQQQSATRDVDELGTFLRWEQLAAYTRAHILGDFGFRGTTRVRRLLSERPIVSLGRWSDAESTDNDMINALRGSSRRWIVAVRAPTSVSYYVPIEVWEPMSGSTPRDISVEWV